MQEIKIVNEIELKLRYSPQERDNVIAYCRQNGFTLHGELVEEDYYLTPFNLDLLQFDEVLRLRHTIADDKERWLLTYKCKNQDQLFHNRREIETAVGDGSALLEMLERMQFTLIRKVLKKRREYKKGALSICLDNVAELGEFMEIEILSNDEVAAQKRIASVRQELKLAETTVETRNYLAMLLEKDRLEVTHE